MKFLTRLVHAARYLRTGQLPPNPGEAASNAYFIALGETRDMVAASAARDKILTGGAK